jgi:hypothetical protein
MSIFMFGILCSSVIISGNVLGQDGEIILIDSDVTWVEDDFLEGNLKIINGGKLTISNSELTISSGSSIEVDEGGKLIIDNSTLLSENMPTGLIGYGYCDSYNRSALIIHGENYDNDFEVIIEASYGTSFNGASAYIGEEIILLNGTEFSYSFNNQDGIVEIGLQGYGCTTPVSISKVKIRHGELIIEYNAIQMDYRNMKATGERNYEIHVSGMFYSYNSNIMGAKIKSTGEINLIDTHLDRSGPILIEHDNSVIKISGESKFTSSLDDHDIRAFPESMILWGDEVSGSGGLTDKWERRIKGQYLEFDAVYVEYQILGLYGINKYTNFSNEEGISYIDGGRERIVEIEWSDDNIWANDATWSEDAIINVIKYRTAWNPENSEIGNYGTYGIKLGNDMVTKIDQNTPSIQWVSLESKDNINSSLGSIKMVAKIINNGDAAAHLAISCYINSTGEMAQTDSFPNSIIAPRETGEIIFNWQSINPGAEQLDCKILTPTQLVKEDSFGGGNFISSTINWEKASEDGQGLSYIMPIMIALIIGIISIGYFLVNRK